MTDRRGFLDARRHAGAQLIRPPARVRRSTRPPRSCSTMSIMRPRCSDCGFSNIYADRQPDQRGARGARRARAHRGLAVASGRRAGARVPLPAPGGRRIRRVPQALRRLNQPAQPRLQASAGTWCGPSGGHSSFERAVTPKTRRSLSVDRQPGRCRRHRSRRHHQAPACR